MRKLSGVVAVLIVGVALYFTVVWGAEGLGMLTSPTYGLDDVWRSQHIFAIGHILGLAPIGLIKLAAFFATLKFAVAVICVVHIGDRLRRLMRSQADARVLEAGLILVVAICILAVGPAVWSQNVELVREYTVQLVLAGLAVAACAVERGQARATELQEPATAAPQGSFAPWR